MLFRKDSDGKTIISGSRNYDKKFQALERFLDNRVLEGFSVTNSNNSVTIANTLKCIVKGKIYKVKVDSNLSKTFTVADGATIYFTIAAKVTNGELVAYISDPGTTYYPGTEDAGIGKSSILLGHCKLSRAGSTYTLTCDESVQPSLYKTIIDWDKRSVA